MSTYNMDQTDLRTALTPNIDLTIRNEIIDYLVGKTAWTNPDDGSRILTQTGVGITNPAPTAKVLIELNANNTVRTHAGLNAIIENTPADVSLLVETNYYDPQSYYVQGPDGSSSIAPYFDPSWQGYDYGAIIATGRGDDRIELQANASFTVFTGAGNDTIIIDPFALTHPYLEGANSKDSINAGDGNDFIADSGWGDSTLIGGSGDDQIYWTGTTYWNGQYRANAHGTYGDKLYGGAGNDTLVAGPNGGIGVELHGGGNSDVLISASSVSPYPLDAYELFGDDGNDALYGGGAGDVLDGGAGNDTLTSGTFGAGDNQYLDGGDDNDVLLGASLQTDGTYLGGNHETLHGGNGNDALYSLSSHNGNTSNTLFGDAGSDLLVAGSGYDTLSGGDDNDILVGGSYTDTMDGGSGDDALFSGSDIFYATMLDGGSGNDTLYGGLGSDTLYGGVGDDVLVGAYPTAELHGGADNDTIYSFSISGHAAKLYGDAGDDTLYGGAGNDTLYGGSGNDVLVAGLGNQTLIGGNDGSSFLGSSDGTASMVGGNGQDYFYLFNATSHDTIDGGSGDLDSVTFNQAASDVVDLTAGSTAGSIDVNFSNGQVVEVTGIEYLIFTDGYSKIG